MAISPKLLSDNIKKEVDKLEEIIDQQLIKLKVLPGGILNIDKPIGMTYTHLPMLRERYKAAGWDDVKLKSDQRDGDWVEFTA